ncbi:MAG: hypothetical protein IPK08_03940 [Bacteroidetes bacterium]|nr:hypothetical protein [Bacteroidota bacterium]
MVDPDDTSLCERILQTASVSNAVNLCGKLNLLDTASLMRDATMNFRCDSGPLHLASATNAPVTAFSAAPFLHLALVLFPKTAS